MRRAKKKPIKLPQNWYEERVRTLMDTILATLVALENYGRNYSADTLLVGFMELPVGIYQISEFSATLVML